MKQFAFLLIIIVCLAFNAAAAEERPVIVFAGSASQPPLEEATKLFEEKTGIPVVLHLGGSGAMLSQVRLSGQGDLYIPGSPDYMEKAIADNLVSSLPTRLAYLVPAMIVAEGNPLHIHRLQDLTRENLRIGIADPDGVCVGLYAVEILEANGLLDQVRPNLKGLVESCAKAASMIPLKLVDVVLGWREFEAWRPEMMDAILPEPAEIPRIAYIPAARLRQANNPQGAEQLLAFLSSEEGRSIFRKWGYYTEEADVRRLSPQAIIGGEYQVPEDW